MAKSKNHTNHNQTFKNHRNGIKKPKTHRKRSTKGVYQKFLKNQKFVQQGNRKAVEAAIYQEVQKVLEQQGAQ
eukprot:EC690510.1.p4 GENE.EC690510.1~~EC690510.1.p4  ORF type:complete len:73 (+),score=36.31 EC690510.1:83-301(+)